MAMASNNEGIAKDYEWTPSGGLHAGKTSSLHFLHPLHFFQIIQEAAKNKSAWDE